jgi:hypothetical protein
MYFMQHLSVPTNTAPETAGIAEDDVPGLPKAASREQEAAQRYKGIAAPGPHIAGGEVGQAGGQGGRCHPLRPRPTQRGRQRRQAGAGQGRQMNNRALGQQLHKLRPLRHKRRQEIQRTAIDGVVGCHNDGVKVARNKVAREAADMAESVLEPVGQFLSGRPGRQAVGDVVHHPVAGAKVGGQRMAEVVGRPHAVEKGDEAGEAAIVEGAVDGDVVDAEAVFTALLVTLVQAVLDLGQAYNTQKQMYVAY